MFLTVFFLSIAIFFKVFNSFLVKFLIKCMILSFYMYIFFELAGPIDNSTMVLKGYPA